MSLKIVKKIFKLFFKDVSNRTFELVQSEFKHSYKKLSRGLTL